MKTTFDFTKFLHWGKIPLTLFSKISWKKCSFTKKLISRNIFDENEFHVFLHCEGWIKSEGWIKITILFRIHEIFTKHNPKFFSMIEKSHCESRPISTLINLQPFYKNSVNETYLVQDHTIHKVFSRNIFKMRVNFSFFHTVQVSSNILRELLFLYVIDSLYWELGFSLKLNNKNIL